MHGLITGDITKRIVDALLAPEDDDSSAERAINSRLMPLTNDRGSHTLWDRGRSLTIEQCCQLIDDDEKETFRGQGKGMCTFIRNQFPIFVIERGRMVRLRCFALDSDKVTANGERKGKPCWFHYNHPNGCPIVSDHCTYSHGDDAAPNIVVK